MNLQNLKKAVPVLLITLIAFGVNFATADAQVLFDNGPATIASPNGAYADPGSDFSMAGNVFTPTMSGTATTLSFVGWYTNSILPTDNFTISLYSVSGGAPDTLIAASSASNLTRTYIGTSIYGPIELYAYTLTLNTPFSLATSSSYYLGFSDATSPVGAFAIAEADVPGPATTEFSINAVDAFSENTGYSLSFQLSASAAPEPSTDALMLSGLALLGFVGYRRRQIAVRV